MVLGIGWLYLQFSLFTSPTSQEVKTHHCEVLHGAHTSVLTAESSSQLFFGAFFSQRKGVKVSVQGLDNAGGPNLLCVKVQCIQQEESLLQ